MTRRRELGGISGGLLNSFVSRASLNADTLLMLFVLAILANIAYCAAHAVDVVVQLSTFRVRWLRMRWMLLGVGVIFAAVLAQFFSRGFFWNST